MAKRIRKPATGEAFTVWQGDESGDVETLEKLADELAFYGPRRFAAEIANCRALVARQADEDWPDAFAEAVDDACNALTEYAQRFNPYAYFGAHVTDPESFGFWVSVDSAVEDADLRVEDLCEVPRAFSGLVAHVNDHGNVTAYRFARGRGYELFAVV
jgi:hypothetical protein